MQKSKIFSVGLAIFAMLFGAGNVVFPLDLGRSVGSQVLFAILGLTLTGVIVPLIGLISAALFDGSYKKFLGMTGRIPGMFIALVCMLLIGPFGATPRCVTLACAAIQWHMPQLSLFIFSLLAAALIFLATMKKSYVVELLGKFLGPIKLTLLLSIVVLGLFSSAQVPHSDLSAWSAFLKGFREGYWTLDLLATIFFSGLIIAAIKTGMGQKNPDPKLVAKYGLQAGLIGGLMLGVVYTGFCVLAAKYGLSLVGATKEQLLSAVATLVLGARASILANAAMAMACMTTAIALTAVFADYLTHEVFLGKIKYSYALLLTVTTTFIMANLGFTGIAQVIAPLAILFYPSLIALSLANIAYVFWGFRFIKPVVFATFALTVISNYVCFDCLFQLFGF